MDTSKQISALKMAQQWFNQHRLPERADDVKAEHVIKAIEIALAEQSAQPESNLKFDGELPQPDGEPTEYQWKSKFTADKWERLSKKECELVESTDAYTQEPRTAHTRRLFTHPAPSKD